MEFERTSRTRPYAYLVLYDPSIEDCEGQQLEATWADSPGPIDAVLVDTIGTMSITPSNVSTDFDGSVRVSLPQAVPSPLVETPQPFPAYFAQRGRDAPVLLLAARQVSWSVVGRNTSFDEQADASDDPQASGHTESIEIARPTKSG